jgi:LysM repeat protein
MKNKFYFVVLIVLLSSCAANKNYTSLLYNGTEFSKQDSKTEKYKKESIDLLGYRYYISTNQDFLRQENAYEIRSGESKLTEINSDEVDVAIRIRNYKAGKGKGLVATVNLSRVKAYIKTPKKKKDFVYYETESGMTYELQVVTINGHQFFLFNINTKEIEKFHLLSNKLSHFYKNGMIGLAPKNSCSIKIRNNGKISLISETGEFYVLMPSKYVKPYDVRYFESSSENNNSSVSSLLPPEEVKAAVSKQKTTKQNKKYHTVVRGDSLWKISEKYYGSGKLTKKLYDLNPGLKTNISIGQKIRIE